MAKNAQNFEERPWGTFEVIHEFNHSNGDDVVIKKLIVYPGKRLSLQSHKGRREHWLIIEGEGMVTLDDQEVPIGPESKVEVKLGTKHRMTNTHPEKNMVVIEVGMGQFDEFDNTRHEDDFGRVLIKEQL